MIEESIREFLTDEVSRSTVQVEITLDSPLLETGVLDSLGIMQLVAFLEETHGIEIEDAELTPGNFTNARTIAQLVRSKAVTGDRTDFADAAGDV